MKIQIVEPRAERISSVEFILEGARAVEAAGRTCYKSEDKIKDGSYATFIKAIVGRGHESVIEHGSATFRLIGSRAFSHQFVRHRIGLAISQESQRYCDYTKERFGEMLQVICPPNIVKLPPGVYEYRTDSIPLWYRVNDDGSLDKLDRIMTSENARFADDFLRSCARAYVDYGQHVERGVPAEDARYYLPNATKTELVITANFREWRHIFQLRAANTHAQWEIRKITGEALTEMKRIVPFLFEDISGV